MPSTQKEYNGIMATHTVKTVLAAIDTTPESQAVFKQALVLASSMRARVVLVSVTPLYEGNMNRLFFDNGERELGEPFREILRNASRYATSLGLELSAVHRTGKPAEEIIAVAEDEKASILLIGTADRTQVGRMLLGRITAEIVVGSPCDVLLMPGIAELRLGRILVGINDSSASMEAGERALAVAASYGIEVHALSAIDISMERSLRYGALKEAEQKGYRLLQDYAVRGEKRGFPVITELRRSMPAEGLTDYAREKGIHLIVLGSPGDVSVFDMLWGNGSVIERVASLATCPVLVAKKNGNGAFC